jgi:ABC-type bacteriocin/lantibiotic exporter with double-glycine peptidase domain
MNKLPKKRQKIKIKAVAQKNGTYCGPAVLQMLFSHLGLEFTQDQIVDTAKIRTHIRKYGMQPRQMAQIVETLSPDYQYWFKQKATLVDLVQLIRRHHQPVGIDWQGLFYKTPEAEKPSKADKGHYSIVIDVDKAKNTITILDPYPEFALKPRVLPLDWFQKRWWDTADDKNPQTGKFEKIKTTRFIYLIAPKTAKFPSKFGMQLPKALGMLKISRLSELFAKLSNKAF